MEEYEQKKLEAIKAIDFLHSHPAFSPEISAENICEGLTFWLSPVCKNGYNECVKDLGINVYIDSELGRKYKHLLEEEWEREGITDENEKLFSPVEVPYETIFGYPWKFHRVEYQWELTFFVFEGNPYKLKDSYDYKKWGRYAASYYGSEGGAETFEDMIIDVAKHVKKEFGDFSFESFMTPQEIANHNEERPFLSTDPDDDLDKIKTHSVVWNTKHVDIYNGLINLRWLDWYLNHKTEGVIAKDWAESTLKGWKKNIAKIEKLMPESRREILAKYN